MTEPVIPLDICKCGHPFSVHTKDERSDVARIFNKNEQWDYKTDKVFGQAGCTLCDCPHPAKG
jgi:hypothetical protein